MAMRAFPGNRKRLPASRQAFPISPEASKGRASQPVRGARRTSAPSATTGYLAVRAGHAEPFVCAARGVERDEKKADGKRRSPDQFRIPNGKAYSRDEILRSLAQIHSHGKRRFPRSQLAGLIQPKRCDLNGIVRRKSRPRPTDGSRRGAPGRWRALRRSGRCRSP